MNVVVFKLHESGPRQLYDQLFESCAGAFVQQSTWWAEVIAELGPDTPFFLLATDGGEPVAGLPLYLFEHPLGNVLVSVPQAGPLGGIFCRDDLPTGTVDACYGALLREALALGHQHRCLSVTIITNPFRDDLALYRAHFAPDFLLENYTQFVDLREYFAPDGAVRLPDYHRRSNLSRNLAKARAANLTVRFDVREPELDALHALHAKRHAEIAAVPLDPRLVRNIARQLVPRRKAFFTVVEHDGAVASWGVHLHHRQVLDVLRLNLDSDQAPRRPNFFNTDASLRHAREAGAITYNWQSSPGRASGVYRYKQQWGARESTYYFVTRLLCPPDRLARIGLDTMRREYPLHFVAPYDAAATGFRPGEYRKQ